MIPDALDEAPEAELAERLASAHRNQSRLPLAEFPAPANLSVAYDLADRAARLIGQRTVGWKIGATQTVHATAAGLSEPFSGRIFEGQVLRSGDKLALEPHALVMLEPEYLVELGADLAAPGKTYGRSDVEAAVARVMIGMEIAMPHLEDFQAAGGLRIIADNGACAGIVVGPVVALPTIDALTLEPVSVCVDGVAGTRGSGAEVMGHPYAALAWLANHCLARGEPLRAGQLVSTGSCARFAPATSGQSAFADFGSLGRVHLRL